MIRLPAQMGRWSAPGGPRVWPLNGYVVAPEGPLNSPPIGRSIARNGLECLVMAARLPRMVARLPLHGLPRFYGVPA
jgi:hypothetical protein